MTANVNAPVHVRWLPQCEEAPNQKVWHTECGNLRVTASVRPHGTKYVAEVKDGDGWRWAKESDLGPSYIRYYGSLREAAEAAEQALAGTSPVQSNREEWLRAIAAQTENTPMTTATKTTNNGVYRIKEKDARKLLAGLGLTAAANGDCPRMERKLAALEDWAGDVEIPEDPEVLEMHDALEAAIIAGKEISVTPDRGKTRAAKQEADGGGTQKADPPDEPAPAKEEEEKAPPTAGECPWEIKSRRFLKLTPAIAKRFHEMAAFPRDRKIKKPIIAMLQKALHTGTHRGCEFACVEVDGVTYRVNGKHNAHVFTDWSDAGGELPNVQVVVSEYTASSMVAAIKLYGTFDNSPSSRSKQDNIKTAAAADASLSSMQDATLKLICSGVAIGTIGHKYRHRDADDQIALLLENVDFAVFFNDLLKSKKEADFLWKAPVVGAMYLTFKADADKAVEFWEMVRDDSDGKKTDPERVLRNWLIKHKIGTVNTDPEHCTTEMGMLCHCVAAWNAWRGEGRYNGELDVERTSPLPEAV